MSEGDESGNRKKEMSAVMIRKDCVAWLENLQKYPCRQSDEKLDELSETVIPFSFI